MKHLDAYDAVQEAKEKARLEGREVTDEMIEDEMYKKGYSRGKALGAGVHIWKRIENK